MSDIVTRLLLKTNEFDANLNNSKQSVNSFQGKISGMAKTAGAGIAKFAGGIGLATGATEVFTKIMGSQQATQDEWDNNVFAAKLTVDKFFTSINNGDWTSFQNGFINSLKDAKNLSAEIDALNDKRLSLTYIKSEALASIEGNKAIATDTTQPISVRNKAFANMQQQRIELERKTNETIKKENDVLINTLNVKYGELNWSDGDIIEFVVDTNFTGGSAEFMSYKEQLANLQSKEKKTTYNAGGVMGGLSSVSVDKAAIERTRQFKLQNQHLEKQRILEQEIDDTRRKSINTITQQANERRELSALAKAENRIEKQLNKADGSGGKTTTEDAALSGSLAYFDVEIAKKNKELINATTAQARAAVKITIDELEAKKINLKIELDKEVFKSIHGEAKGGKLKKAGLPTQGIDAKKITPFKTKSPISKKDIKLNEEYNESLTSMGRIMGSLSGAFDGNAGSVLQWGATLLATIGQAIPAILSMIPVKAADTLVTNTNTTAEIANAGSKVLSAHAGIPFVGIALGLAGVASIIAVMASMPKFAMGGIVPGVSFTGDKVPALLNSGEMILNGGQQANLFRVLNSGFYSGITDEQVRPSVGDLSRFIMPDETSREMVISGTLRANGNVLEAVLNNHIHKKSKVR